MHKSVIVGIVVAIIVIAGGGVILATHKANAPAATSDMSSMNKNNTPSTSSTATATNAVTLQDFAFSPANITVKKGTTVTWTNKDSATHTVTETDGKAGPNSGDLATGKTYSFTFDTVGSFKYDCSIHTSMVGTVTVTE